MTDLSNCHLVGYVLDIEMRRPMQFEVYLVKTVHCNINDGMNVIFLHWPVGRGLV